LSLKEKTAPGAALLTVLVWLPHRTLLWPWLHCEFVESMQVLGKEGKTSAVFSKNIFLMARKCLEGNIQASLNKKFSPVNRHEGSPFEWDTPSITSTFFF